MKGKKELIQYNTYTITSCRVKDTDATPGGCKAMMDVARGVGVVVFRLKSLYIQLVSPKNSRAAVTSTSHSKW